MNKQRILQGVVLGLLLALLLNITSLWAESNARKYPLGFVPYTYFYIPYTS